jgi:Ca2+-binding EF-hand superfamily protein
MTESGLLEAGEFLYMVEDMAAQNEWYTDATVATIDGLARGSIALGLDGDGGEPLRRSGDIGYLAGTTFGVETHLPPPASLESAMAETRQQLALIDLASLSEGFGCTLSDGISMPFRRRDPMSTGLLAARDVDLALGELGVILKPDEFAMVARKFAYKPGSSEQERGDSRMHDVERATAKSVRGALVNSQGSSAPPPRVSYPLLVRWIIDTVCEERGIDPAVGARMNMGAQGKWYERLSEIARRLRKAVCKTGLENRKGWIEALKRRFEEFDMDDNGQLGRREFMRVLSLSGIDLSDAESKALMAHLDSNHDGSVSWQEFIEFFSSDGELRLGDDNAPIVKEPWYAIATDVAERLLDVMRSKGSAVSQRAWLGTLRRALDEADADGSGSLSKGELSKCLSAVGIKMDPLDLERLHRAIDEDGNGEVSYAELTSFLRRHASQWHLAEAEVAAKIVRAMGTGNLSRRTWLTRLRKQFFSSDSFRSGVMGASDLLRVLREMGVDLTRGEEARLLDALEGEPSAVDDADGGVAYGELLAFCARHAGKWHEAHPDLADRLREAMKQRAHSASDLRRLFRQFDVDGNGTIDATEFELALRRLGLSDLTLAEKGILMDAVDSNGTGAIAYGELIAFYTSSEPWHRSNKDLTERLARALEGSGPSGGALRELRMRFREADRLGAGSITRKQFQDVLRSLPGTRALDPSEVDRLMGCLDSDGDGRVSYRELLGFIAGHMGSWESRLPDIASDLSFQLNRSPYGRAATVQNLERRIKIADPDETGRLGPLSLGRCLRSVGLGLNENQLMQLVGAMDTHGDGRVPIGPLLDFLVHHASPDSRSPSDPAAEQLAHKFREIVWTEVKREGGSRKNWHAGLRHVFDRHLDVDGDGFITLPDLRTALPELGIRCDAPDIRPLFTMMESRQDLGQVSFRDFSDFMLGAEGFSSTSTVRRRSYTSSLALQAERQARPFVCRHAVSGDEERRRGSSQGHAPYAWVKQSESGRQVKLALKLLGQTQTSLQQARRAFTSLDPGRTGRLSPMKAKVALSEMGLDASKVRREDWQNLMQSLDQDSHGNIFYQDLLDVLFGAVTHSAADEMEDHAPHPRIAPEPHPQTRRRTSVRGVAILNAERVITLRRDILSDLEASVGKNAAAERAVSRALESFSGKSTTIRNNRAHSSRAEIKKSLARCGVRLDATQESDLFTKLDPDCRGSIGREDFLAFLFHPESGLSSVMEARRSNQSHTDERRAVPESDFEAKVRRELRPQAKAVEDLIKILAKGRSRVLSERDLRHAVRQAGLNISTSGLSFIVRKTKGNSERGVSTQSLVDFFRQPRRSTPADEMEVLASLRAHGGGRRPSTASAGGVHSSRRAAVPQDRRVSSELLISGRPLH